VLCISVEIDLKLVEIERESEREGFLNKFYMAFATVV